LLEHPHVYTLGVRADLRHVLVPPASVGAELVRTDRGGDVTYHGPGQLTGYPILSRPGKNRRQTGMADTVAYVRSVEQVLIDALADVGLRGAGRLREYPGVWVDPDGPAPRKIAAIGVKLSRGRTMHGFALNVSTDLAMFGHIVPCGIDKPVTSLSAEGVDATMADVVAAVATRAAEAWSDGEAERQDVAWRHRPDDLAPFSRGEGAGAPVRLVSRLEAAGVTGGLAITERKPEWLRAHVSLGPDVRGSRLPQPVGVLGRRHRHVHVAGRALHSGLRLLPHRHPPSRPARSRGARPSGGGGRPHGAGPRCHHDGGA